MGNVLVKEETLTQIADAIRVILADYPEFKKVRVTEGGGGMGGKMTPSAVLVIKDGNPKLVNIKEQDGLTKILDMVPDFIERFTGKGSDDSEDNETLEGTDL